jgi:L-alanine-DL-glutamate epimerase-like enolase superfamily enzyme
MIDEIELFRLEIPLTSPYKLALGSVGHFDTILVRLRAEGRVGLGEATILTGYTGETIDQSWMLATRLAERFPGLDATDAKQAALAHFDSAPFTISAFVSALEMAEGHRLLRVDAPARVPILAVVNAMDPAGIEAEIERFVLGGSGTLKVKVGFDADADLERVRLIQRLNRGRARLRLDANQGFSADDGCRFAAALDPDSIELFEQPCAAADWNAAIAVARAAAVPMMLDESIYGLADIERAAETNAARFVKLKLMKMGGLERLEQGLLRIRALGMEPVLGNGVATEIGCWMEACVARTTIRNAGEMNGFLKPSIRLLKHPLTADRGAIALDTGFAPALDEAALTRVSVGTTTFTARRAQAHA